MDDIAEINYKVHNHDIENIWYIFFCLSDTTFSSIELVSSYDFIESPDALSQIESKGEFL